MSQMDFSGCHIPLVTPFKDDLSIDEDGLRRLVDYFIEEEKVDGLAPCGTTGESPTLSHEEHNRVVEIVVKQTRGRVPVIAGTGSNSTEEAIFMTRHAEDTGADATLQVCPYYNKPTQGGIIAHFEAIAKATRLPIIIYNIPGRTGRNIEPETIIKLSEIETIVGLKDAANDINQTMTILKATMNRSKKFYILSGEDAITFPMLVLGGHGTICAVGNVIGREFTQMVHLVIREGNIPAAREIHYRMLPTVKALFIETNPVPVKEAMNMIGLPAGPLRLPLIPMQPKNRELLRQCLLEIGRLKA